MLKIVLDTNIFVSSLLSKQGAPAQVVNAWRERGFLLCCSPAILSEVGRVLGYSKLRKKYAITSAEVEELMELLHKETLMTPGKVSIEPVIGDDTSDEIFLVCALEAGADLIVSGDRHLLELGAYEGIPILTVGAFLERLG